MPYIIVIDKTGTVKEINIKEYVQEDLYKKANFKSSEGFCSHHKWTLELNNNKYNIVIYGKKNGKAGQENKYEFPPPIDNILFFGGCVIVNENVNKLNDLRISEWNAIYENLMGGFEDLREDAEEDDTEEEEPNEYVYDDFLVEDDDVSEQEPDPEQEEELEEEYEVSSKKKTSKKKEKKLNKKIELEISNNANNYLDCQSELEEEEYFA